MKEMVGGCCVCSDERGWPENPLVYCDGQACTVAVHQACYGIVTVPTGPWYCRKCESQERSARVRCELCPSKDGALKRTDNAGWAHVVCALYIPEVRFGNVTTMEPIILQLIPPERFSKCYICEEVYGKGNGRATIGACMQCNKGGCRMQFHVTCAQSLGLLCEEAGNYLDNVKYCGYCQHHYRKLLKRPNIKTIPAYKPVPAIDSHSSDSSPEKEADTSSGSSTKPTLTTVPNASNVTGSSNNSSSNKRKSNSSSSKSSNSTVKTSNSSSSNPKSSSSSADSGNSSGTSGSSTTTQKSVQSSSSSSSSNKLVDKLGNNKNSTSSSAVKKFSADLLQDIATIQAAAAAADKVGPSEKILITAVTDTKYIDNPQTPDTDKDSVKSSSSKKRKAGSRTPTPNSIAPDVATTTSTVTSLNVTTTSNITVPTSTVSNVGKSTPSSSPYENRTDGDKIKKIKTDHIASPKQSPGQSVGSPLISSSEQRPHSNNSAASTIIQPPIASSPQLNNLPTSVAGGNTSSTNVSNQTSVLASSTTNSIYTTDNKPIIGTNGNLINPMVTLEPLGPYVSSSDGGLKITYEKQPSDSPNSSASRQSSIPMDIIAPEEVPEKRARSQSIDTNKTERPSTRGKKRASTGNTTASTSNTTVVANKRSSRSQTASSSMAPAIQGAFSSITQARQAMKESPPSSPGSETAGSVTSNRRAKGRKSNGANTSTNQAVNLNSNSNSHDSKDIKIFQNGINAPHMLGNQLNPNSHMAQKMSDHLNSELEAHSIFSPDALPANSLVGPQLHSRIIAAARGNNSNHSNGSGGFSMLGVGASGVLPQTLDQLLERQWEQGSQFLMEQAQHFDIASLLSCLHQLRAENTRLEEHVSSLLTRRDHLLAVNARLAIPLSTTLPLGGSITPIQTTAPSMPVPNDVLSRSNRGSTNSNFNPPNPSNGPVVENGLPVSDHLPNTSNSNSYPNQSQQYNRSSNSTSQPSPTIRHSQSSSYVPTSSSVQQHGVLRGSRSGSVSDTNRGSQSQQYSAYPQGQIPVVTSQAQHPHQQINARRENDMHHQMGTSSSKPS